MSNLFGRHLAGAAILAVLAAGPSAAQAEKTSASAANGRPTRPELRREVGKAFDAAVAYYRTVQEPNGAFAPDRFGVGITALAVTGMLRTERVTLADPMIAKAFKYLEGSVRPDGGIYPKGGGQKNYHTSVALLAFVEANKDGRYKKQIADATKFLKGVQWLAGKATPNDPQYGGWGYDGNGRPDLSNTALVLESLNAAGLPPEDEAFKAAVTFLRRTQNYRGEGGNDMAAGAAADMDGGHYYTVVENKPGGAAPEARPSYGAMTYAGLKSFIYAGVGKDDPRVQAAFAWIKKNYSVETHPGQGAKGLYYYYHTFAKALRTLETDKVTDDKGVAHDWRADLVKTLLARQKKDGSWINTDRAFLESEGRLATAFALLALTHAVGS